MKARPTGRLPRSPCSSLPASHATRLARQMYIRAQRTVLLYNNLNQGWALTQGRSGWEMSRFLKDEAFLKGRFSPDGHWLVYQNAGTGLYAVNWPPTGAKWQITPAGVEPVWRRDGKELYFIRGGEILGGECGLFGPVTESGPTANFVSRSPAPAADHSRTPLRCNRGRQEVPRN